MNQVPPMAMLNANQVQNLQEWLVNLNSSNFEETKDLIINSFFYDSDRGRAQLLENVLKISEYRTPTLS